MRRITDALCRVDWLPLLLALNVAAVVRGLGKEPFRDPAGAVKPVPRPPLNPEAMFRMLSDYSGSGDVKNPYHAKIDIE